MDIFQHRYYRLSKISMTLCGSWPYQSTCTRWSIFVFLFFTLVSQMAPQILALVKYRNERDDVIDCIIPLLFEAICACKYLCCLWNLQRVMELLNRIRTDWQVWAWDREVTILHKYADQGRKMSLALTDLSILQKAEIYSAVFLYVAQPTIPKVIDVLLKNGTAPGEFPFPVDYYHLDMQKYYFYFIMHTWVCICLGSMLFVAGENMLIIYVQHVCGVFTALGCKLQRIGHNQTSVQSEETSHALDKRAMVDLGSCIDRHNKAIDFAKLIDATYTWNIFYNIILGGINLNLVGLQILFVKNNPEVTVRFIGYALAALFNFFIDCYISQNLMNSSMNIHFYIYDSQWYKMARKSQNLLQLMIMRCSVSCKLTVGNFFTLSIETYGQMFRTAISYFTVLCQMQT